MAYSLTRFQRPIGPRGSERILKMPTVQRHSENVSSWIILASFTNRPCHLVTSTSSHRLLPPRTVDDGISVARTARAPRRAPTPRRSVAANGWSLVKAANGCRVWEAGHGGFRGFVKFFHCGCDTTVQYILLKVKSGRMIKNES